ncbi:UV DNA damage repair endonuclease UvsE [Virgibacillus xinjiangensis]|uniref:UV DNA damage repair endonuclease UvsE n=1 Tax=Virgibacillus xinjiangensis TaxID=393090 RepID=A0ABV7CRI0_9BACI
MTNSTLFRLGYVAMSVNVKNCSPSQTMTYKRFQQIEDKEAAVSRLERIAESNFQNSLRLLKHNLAHDIKFFRLSSRLVPLATHEELAGWDYLEAIRDDMRAVGNFAQKHNMRLDFHPDHFVVLNSTKDGVFNASVKNLIHHAQLLKGMGIDLTHRSVLHVGGTYKNKPRALEQFISNWAHVPAGIQKMLMIENDDKSFNLQDCLFLGEKLGIPVVFDYHHHLANHEDVNWESHWDRVIGTWESSPLPLKMHISSPKSDQAFRSHADFVDSDMFMRFLKEVNGSVPQMDCMIEAKKKDSALFQLMKDLKDREDIEVVDEASFYVKT